MTTSELALLDTNILVYAADHASPFHEPSKRLRDQGANGTILIAVSPQILLEFFAVITSPKRVDNPRTKAEAIEEVEKYVQSEHIRKIYPGPDILTRVLTLLKKYEVTRQEIFDLHLVATMLSNDVKRLYTYNRDHFVRFIEIEVSTPQT
jgi:uncharacterized protein